MGRLVLVIKNTVEKLLICKCVVQSVQNTNQTNQLMVIIFGSFNKMYSNYSLGLAITVTLMKGCVCFFNQTTTLEGLVLPDGTS